MDAKEPRASIPTWAYKDGQSRIFDHPDDVPKGWSDTPRPAKPEKPMKQHRTGADD